MAGEWMFRNGNLAEAVERAATGLEPFCLWGILNRTPDSFSDGGRWLDLSEASSHARAMAGHGACVLDLGGASSRPGAPVVSEEEELARVLPLLAELDRQRRLEEEGERESAYEALACLEVHESASGVQRNFEVRESAPGVPASPEARKSMSGVRTCPQHPEGVFSSSHPLRGRLFSVDTWRSGVAAAALSAGADIINDVTACGADPALLEVLAQHRPGYVLTHCQPGKVNGGPGSPGLEDEDILTRVLRFFESGLARLVRAGLPERNIILDPGIGFGKDAFQGARLLAAVERLGELGRPVLIGLSRKSLFWDWLRLPLAERGEATNIVVALLASRGVLHHRVHDVAGAANALRLTRILAGGSCLN